ncbi:hypothetical protein SOASR032_24310 [Pragia fontium]|uniref:Glycosyltransferase 2-like domain-containing protein n=1 Tax=Pragia fontium TaxID=82985 RepID=A0ABQ5LLW2_9GAMM|nr:glycosyltransferase [Pragia fontium]GKX63862.1 hypothetical protein SOASR032_24310 [Pragia fontium]
MKNLTICIPTYNREKIVCNQLRSILENVPNNDVEIMIRDNASDDNTYESLSEIISLSEREQITLSKNLTNLGLVGNILRMLEDVNTKFVWFVGDDDVLHPEVFDLVKKELMDINGYGGLFLNYKCIDSEGNIVKTRAFPINYNDKTLIDIFKECDATMMFITSMIYKTNILKEVVAFSCPDNQRITFPLYAALYTDIKYRVKLIEDNYIDDQVSGISWKKRYISVRLWEVPYEIFRLHSLGIKKTKIINIIFNYYLLNRRFLAGCFLRIFFHESIIEKLSRTINKKKR